MATLTISDHFAAIVVIALVTLSHFSLRLAIFDGHLVHMWWPTEMQWDVVATSTDAVATDTDRAPERARYRRADWEQMLMGKILDKNAGKILDKKKAHSFLVAEILTAI